MTRRRSIFELAAGRRAKWVVFAIWLVGMFIAFGANLPGKFTDAEENESTSFLPGDAESTKVLTAAEDLQGGELAPAVIVYRRDAGLTPADLQKISDDAQRLTERRFPAVVADGATAASGGQEGGAQEQGGAPGRRRALCPRAAAGPTTPLPGQPSDYAPFVGPICSPDGKAAIVTAYLRGDGESDSILDPVDFCARDRVRPGRAAFRSRSPGGAGYAADAIKVFESINGTAIL